jgi:4'-phosphopantetheinyl transferase
MRQLKPLALGNREVQLWTVRLEASEALLDQAFSWLSRDEEQRALRFRFEEHRRNFALGRAALRALAASYLQIAPSKVSFVYGDKGKPALDEGGGRLRFNVSNSGDLAAYAFTLDCEIGVDVEHKRRMVDMENVARRFFAPGEVDELMSLAETDRTDGFFNCWTRKEAYIKAVGDGLSLPLGSFQVTLQPGVAARMLGLNGNAEAAKGWTLQTFTPAPDYAGAIAYRDRERPLTIEPLRSAAELMQLLF